MLFRLSSVRARLTFWYLLTLGACLITFAVLVYVIRVTSLNREFDAELNARTQQLAGELRPTLLTLDVTQGLGADRRLVDVPLIVREDPGRVLFQSPAVPPLTWAAQRDLAPGTQGVAPILTVQARDGTTVRVASIVVPRPGAAPLLLQVAASLAPVHAILRQLAMTMALGIVVVLIVAMYGSGITARRALAPVDEIVARVEAIQASDLGERLDVRAGSDEIDRLVSTLNRMLDRIEGAMRAARRFAADASHELQTPIAAMRAAIEMCVREEGGPVEQRAVAADLLTDVDRLSALVRDLRLLALADAGHLIEQVEQVDLSAVALDCCEIARALAEPKRICVEARVPSSLVVRGSALQLRRAVLNLAQNAIQYSPEGSSIELSLDRMDGHAALAVRDHGVGIGADDLPHIFERFYRADPARARASGGTGLGLAITDQIVRLHGGRVDVTSAPGRGSNFVILIPIPA